MLLLTVCFLFAFVEESQSCACGKSTVSRRIVGGEKASEHEFPWLAALRIEKKSKLFLCGGTIINNRYVLTAAHCVAAVRYDPKNITVIIGSNDMSDTEKSVKPIRVKLYDINYSDTNDLHDIALLLLPNALTFSETISPICLPAETFPKHFDNLMAAGWGTTLTESHSQSLRTLYDMTQEDDYCVKLFTKKVFTPHHMCAKAGWQTVCTGDSGGPLMTRFMGKIYVVGITGFGVSCQNGKYPAVFTRVTSYVNWIKMSTYDASFCNTPTNILDYIKPSYTGYSRRTK